MNKPNVLSNFRFALAKWLADEQRMHLNLTTKEIEEAIRSENQDEDVVSLHQLSRKKHLEYTQDLEILNKMFDSALEAATLKLLDKGLF